MGGMGSGHWYRYDSKRTVESCISIDSRKLARGGKIQPGCRIVGSLRWTHSSTGEDAGSMGYTIEADLDGTGVMHLRYTHTPFNGEPEKLDFPVHLETTRPHLGGLRWWFICPLVVNGRPCQRRVAKLYGNGRYFGCRTCKGLAYRSSQEAHQGERVETMLRKLWPRHRGFPDPKNASSAELILMMKALDR
jgi:hypothetical protein